MLRSAATSTTPASGHLRRPRAHVQHGGQDSHPSHDHAQLALVEPRAVNGPVAAAVPAAAAPLRDAALAKHPLVATLMHDDNLQLDDVIDLAGRAAQGPTDPEDEAPDSNSGDPSLAGG